MVKVSAVMSLNDNDYFKQSIESILNQTLEDIEIICIGSGDFENDKVRYVPDWQNILDEINGQYVYFLNQGDVVDENVLKDSFNACADKNLDFIQFDDSGKFDDKVYAFNILREKAFTLDMMRNTKLFSLKFLKKLGDLPKDDMVFFWDAVFNAKRFSFIPLSVRTLAEARYEDQLEAINSTNRVFTSFGKRTLVGQFRFIIFDWRIESLYKTYLSVKDDLKADYYEALKEDFTQMIYHWRFTDFTYSVKPINMLFFDDVVYSRDFEEFEKFMVQYEIALDSEEIKKENEIIRKNIQIIKDENSRIFNSTSWKITKPLRGLK